MSTIKKFIKLLLAKAISFAVKKDGDIPVPETPPGKIALILGHWLGDTFWASQAVPRLAARFPQAELHVILRSDYRDLFYGMIEHDRLHIVPEIISDRTREKVALRNLILAGREYRKMKFDWVIDLTGNRYSAIFTALLKPAWSLGFEGDEFSSLYSFKIHPATYEEMPLRKRVYQVLTPLLGDAAIPEYPCPPRTIYSFSGFCLANNLDFKVPVAVLSPCAGWKQKEWGEKNFIWLAKKLADEGMQVIIVGVSEQMALCRKIADDAGGVKTIAWYGPLGQLCALLSGATIFAGNDSGVGHLAAAYSNCVTFSIFTGATAPAQSAPSGKNVVVLDSTYKKLSFADFEPWLPKNCIGHH